MRASFRFAVSILAALAAGAHAQTPAQQAICDKQGQQRLCAALVQEFNGKTLLNGGASPFDEPDPLQDVGAFAQRYRARAVRAYLIVELRSETAAAAQAALQTISTAASTAQTGSSSASSGASTDLATKPATTDFLSIAAESGAFADTLNSTGVTLTANALGLAKYLGGNHPLFERWNSAAADQLQPWNFSVNLNVTQTGSTAAPTTGTATTGTPSIASVLLPTNNASFQSFTASYVLYRPYNPQSKDFRDKWQKALVSSQSALNTAVVNITTALNAFRNKDADAAIYKDPRFAAVLQAWLVAAKAAEQSPSDMTFAQMVTAYSAYEDFFYEYFAATPDGPKNLLAVAQALEAYNQATYAVLDQARTQLATVTYTFTAAGQKPATHGFKAIYAETFKGAPDLKTGKGSLLTGAQLTGNFAAELYSSLPTGATYGRLRDLQASAEFDKPFGGTTASPRGAISLAGYGQYQYDPTVLNITAGNLAPGTSITLPNDAQVLLGTSGWLGVAQGKLTINLSQGLTLPIALKWSNKTDLLDSQDIRGQIGLSYDLSALGKLIGKEIAK
jgi:hypothetical protein